MIIESAAIAVSCAVLGAVIGIGGTLYKIGLRDGVAAEKHAELERRFVEHVDSPGHELSRKAVHDLRGELATQVLDVDRASQLVKALAETVTKGFDRLDLKVDRMAEDVAVLKAGGKK